MLLRLPRGNMGPVLIKGFSLLQIVYRLFDYWYVPVLVLQQKSNYVWIRTITINGGMTFYRIKLTEFIQKYDFTRDKVVRYTMILLRITVA